jgi:hypothetical protein
MFGQDEQTQRVQALVEKKAQLEAALPVVDDNRAMQIEARLDKIEAQIAREVARAQAIGNVAALRAAMGVDGTGGLEFQAQSPAGVGRLIRLPFYPTAAPGVAAAALTPYYRTQGGVAAISTISPVIGIGAALQANNVDTNVASGAAFTMTTPQISWATLRIVGFEIDDRDMVENVNPVTSTTGANSLVGVCPMPKIVVSDLQIGGGANLFTHEDFGDGNIYSCTANEFCGLRDYPLLKSPNTAQVTVAAVGIFSGNVAPDRFRNMLSHGFNFGAVFIVKSFPYSQHHAKTASKLVFRRVKIFFTTNKSNNLKNSGVSNRLSAWHPKQEKPPTREHIATAVERHGISRRYSAQNAAAQTSPNSYPDPSNAPTTSFTDLAALGAKSRGLRRERWPCTEGLAQENPLLAPL